ASRIFSISRNRSYAEGVTSQSPGSRAQRAHPGERHKEFGYAEGVRSTCRDMSIRSLQDRENVRAFYPGCAARPWALRCNDFGVKPRSNQDGAAISPRHFVEDVGEFIRTLHKGVQQVWIELPFGCFRHHL